MEISKSFGFAGRGLVSEASAARQRRVRTGCLTCRKRHLKCDEATPSCSNCRKSNRECQRGIRLNFIDTTVQAPPAVPQNVYWHVTFQDESRDIASEYKGGLAHYVAENTLIDNNPQLSHSGSIYGHISSQALFSPIEGLSPDGHKDDHESCSSNKSGNILYPSSKSRRQSINSPNPTNPQAEPLRSISDNTSSLISKPRQYLDSQEEVLLMQVFVEEVGLWMDSLDSQKHVRCLLKEQKHNFDRLFSSLSLYHPEHLVSQCY